MAEPLLQTDSLSKAYGAVRACDGVSLEVNPGETLAVIGPNGAGKTTLIGQLSGDLKPDRGSITFGGKDITKLPAHRRARLGIGRSFQITSLFPAFTCRRNVALAQQAHRPHAFRFWSAMAADRELQDAAGALLERVGLADRADTAAGVLAHGEQRQLELAMALAGSPKLLLLDEPTAGMGPEESARMVALLQDLKGSAAILLIEHDMDAVFALADRIAVLVYGQVIAVGRPEEIRTNAEVRAAYLGDGTEAA